MKEPYVVEFYAWVGLWVVPQAFGFCLGSFEGCCSWVLPFVFWVCLYFGFKVLGVFSCILGGGFFWDVFCSLGLLGVSSGFWVFGGFGFCACVGSCGLAGCSCVLRSAFCFFNKVFLLIKRRRRYYQNKRF
jgi:hypothetical protein